MSERREKDQCEVCILESIREQVQELYALAYAATQEIDSLPPPSAYSDEQLRGVRRLQSYVIASCTAAERLMAVVEDAFEGRDSQPWR